MLSWNKSELQYVAHMDAGEDLDGTYYTAINDYSGFHLIA